MTELFYAIRDNNACRRIRVIHGILLYDTFSENIFPEREMLNDTIPAQELSLRWDRCKNLLHQYIPQAQGLLVFSRLNIYYFSGSFANGVFWLPFSGEPVLFCRRGEERAKIESPLTPYLSVSDLMVILKQSLTIWVFLFPKWSLLR